MNFRKRFASLDTWEIAIEEKKKKKNDSEEIETARASSSASRPSSSRRKDITVSIDAILDISKFLNFENFRSFVKALWPNGDEDIIVRRRLWLMSTRKVETMFLNMKKLEVEFNYDPEREGRQRLVNWYSLSSVFGGIKLPLRAKFVSISELCDAVNNHVRLNSCENYRHASCPCHLGGARQQFVSTAVNECKYGHFHHYCSHHVISWLKIFLPTALHDDALRRIFYNGDDKSILKSLAKRIYPQESNIEHRH